MEIGVGVGGSVRSCNLATDDVSGDCDELVDGVPILTSITFRGAALWDRSSLSSPVAPTSSLSP